MAVLVGISASPGAASATALLEMPGSAALQLAAEEGGTAAPLSQQQLAKLQKFIDANHRKAVIDPKVAKFLGLGKDGKPVTALQVSLIDKDKKVRHIFDRLQDGSGFLVGRRTAGGLAVYRLDNELTSFSTVLWRADGNKVALRNTDAASTLRQELALWARFADQQK